MSATLRRTARSVKHEEVRYANARKTRQTTERTKDDNAGQPENNMTRAADAEPEVAHATQRQKDAALPTNAGVKRRRSRPLE
ncbi:hypothetical protein [Rhodanobacter sp. C05]|uniref:hypothetical protein n=1 Tax=Rhodanobacter sp. C05 TaxID=1945855 RepID=UPI00117A83EC|nr:hypothetical protein [Rhodanobacter sp. C05]